MMVTGPVRAIGPLGIWERDKSKDDWKDDKAVSIFCIAEVKESLLLDKDRRLARLGKGLIVRSLKKRSVPGNEILVLFEGGESSKTNRRFRFLLIAGE
jgi:hypothetical protein